MVITKNNNKKDEAEMIVGKTTAAKLDENVEVEVEDVDADIKAEDLHDDVCLIKVIEIKPAALITAGAVAVLTGIGLASVIKSVLEK